MAGNKRGKLKEHLTGIHRNFDWITHHCIETLKIIGDQKPELSQAIISLGEGVAALDELTKGLYDKI